MSFCRVEDSYQPSRSTTARYYPNWGEGIRGDAFRPDDGSPDTLPSYKLLKLDCLALNASIKELALRNFYEYHLDDVDTCTFAKSFQLFFGFYPTPLIPTGIKEIMTGPS